jgi:pimeloyl-ACP methyl ester carboxylesterase
LPVSDEDQQTPPRITAPIRWQQTQVKARADVAVWTAGSGPDVLMVHGFPDHPCGLFDFAEKIVAAGYRCILPALPGYWPSAPVEDRDYSSESVGRDLLAVVDHLGVGRAAYIGHDWGAEFGYTLAAAHPSRFSTLIALAMPHPSGFAIRRSVFYELRTAWYAFFLAYAPGATVIARDQTWLTTLMQSWSPGMHSPAWPAVTEVLRRPGVMEAVCGYYRANMDAPLTCPRIDIPTLVVHGGQDGCISANCYPPELDAMFSAGVQRLFLPAVGHWPHLEDAPTVLRAIVQWLDDALRDHLL